MHRRTGWREWAEWYRLTPEERFAESEKLWETYLALGGSLEPEPILRALSSIRRIGNKPGARTLLMGGQSCVFYGAAEFDDLRKKRKNDEDWPIIPRLV